MRVVKLSVEGVVGAVKAQLATTESVVHLPAGPEGAVLADGLCLLVAAAGPEAARAVAVDLGLSPPEEAERVGESVELRWERPGAGASLVSPASGRRVTVEAEMVPDPVLYRLLREHATAEPRLLSALAEDPEVVVKVGWLWTPDLAAASVAVLGLRVGDVAFSTVGADRPSWLPRLLRELRAKVVRVDPARTAGQVAARLAHDAWSADPETRGRVKQARAACDHEGFELGALEPVREEAGFEAAFGDGLVRARRFGPFADEVARIVEAAWLDQPDVLVADVREGPRGDALVAWLTARIEGPTATLEQVWVVS